MQKTQFFSAVLGLTACIFSHSLWAVQTCNANIAITKPDSIYIDHLDGTVSDSETKLMWQKCSLGQTWNAGADATSGSDDSCDGSAIASTWQAALARANDNTDYNYSDWRLPNKNELSTLLELACYNPSVNEALFPNVLLSAGSSYWTSSPYATLTSRAWLVSLYAGDKPTANKNKSIGYYVLLVRGGE